MRKKILTKILLCVLAMTFMVVSTPTLRAEASEMSASKTMEESIVLKKGKTYFTVPFENDEPWIAAYKKEYTVSKIQVDDPSIVKAKAWKKHWVNITGLKTGKTKLVITCKDGSVNTVDVRVITGNLDNSKYITNIPTAMGNAPSCPEIMDNKEEAEEYSKYYGCNYSKMVEFVCQAKYNDIIKNEYRKKTKYINVDDKLIKKAFVPIYIVRYGQYPIDESKEYTLACYDALQKYASTFLKKYSSSNKNAKKTLYKPMGDLAVAMRLLPVKEKDKGFGYEFNHPEDCLSNPDAAIPDNAFGIYKVFGASAYSDAGTLRGANYITCYEAHVDVIQHYGYIASYPRKIITNNFQQLIRIDYR